MKIFECVYETDSLGGLHKVLKRVSDFNSFEEYLNLLAVERIELPFYYKLLTRSFDLEKGEVISKIYNREGQKSYHMHSKVIRSNLMTEKEQAFNEIKRVNDEFKLNITDEEIWELITCLRREQLRWMKP